MADLKAFVASLVAMRRGQEPLDSSLVPICADFLEEQAIDRLVRPAPRPKNLGILRNCLDVSRNRWH